MVPYRIINPEPYKPAKQKIEIHSLHELPLRPDRIEQLQQAGAQQSLGGNRGPAGLRIKLPKPFIQFRKRTVHQLANTPQRVLLRHPRLNIDIRKQ